METTDTTSFVDIHSHLVPGVDDGARDIPSVLHSVGRMTRISIRRILTTPHIQGSLTLDPEQLEIRLRDVAEAWERAADVIGEKYPEVEFKAGYEVLLDVPNADLSDPRIRMAGTSFVLIEWPFLKLPSGTVAILRKIIRCGYRPIVAHPERYSGMGQQLELVSEWRAMGAYLQMNFGSLVGRYGRRAQAMAYRLLRRGWVDYMASDFHGHPGLKIYKNEAAAALKALGAEEVFSVLCRTNPSRLLMDEIPLTVPLLPVEKSFWARVRASLNPHLA